MSELYRPDDLQTYIFFFLISDFANTVTKLIPDIDASEA